MADPTRKPAQEGAEDSSDGLSRKAGTRPQQEKAALSPSVDRKLGERIDQIRRLSTASGSPEGTSGDDILQLMSSTRDELMARDAMADSEGFMRSTVPHVPRLNATDRRRVAAEEKGQKVPHRLRRQRKETQSVFFDEPGPRARARIAVFNVIGALLAIALVVWIIYRLGHPLMGPSQLSWKLWEPALGWSAWRDFYLPGIGATLLAAVVSIVGAVILGFVFALGRLSRSRAVRLVCSVIVEFCRAVPVLLFMIFFWRLFAGWGLRNTAPFWAVCAGLVCYNGSVVTELIRSGVGNLPRGQHEAATALGMGHVTSLLLVEFPQAIIASMPALISQLVVVLKDSALGSVISYADLLQRSRRLGSLHFDPLQTLLVAGVIYLVLCGWLSKLSTSIPERMQRRTTGISRARAIQPEAILDPNNLNQQERASHELPFGGVEPEIPDHYHGSNAVITGKWSQNHREEGHDYRRPHDRRRWYEIGYQHVDPNEVVSRIRDQRKAMGPGPSWTVSQTGEDLVARGLVPPASKTDGSESTPAEDGNTSSGVTEPDPSDSRDA